MYLIDTDILSNLTKRSPPMKLIAKFASVPLTQQYTSSITVGEMVFGAYLATSRTKELLDQIKNQLLVNLAILPFDTEAAYRYGELRAQLQHLGTPIGDADTRIASIALSRNLIMVTGNVRHFQRIPELTVENWLE